MNYFDPYSAHPDRVIVSAWNSQVQHADNTLWLTKLLSQHDSKIFVRFASCYSELRALPRGARRSVQRRLAHSRELAAILPEYLQQGGRRLQHRMARSLAGAALLLALTQSAATAATITVTTNNPNIVADGQCSLIEAIINANNDAATHADCAAGGGADTIVLPSSATLTLTDLPDFGPGFSLTGLPLISSPITIQGNGATIARDANAVAFRLIAVTNSGDLTLQNVTLSGGISNSYGTPGGRSSWNGGGGAISNNGALTMQNSSISGNTAFHGGGVLNLGTLTVENSTISGNTAGGGFGGGGVFNGGFIQIEKSTSHSPFNAGSFCLYSYFFYRVFCYHRYSGEITISNSTISGNSVNASGGGVVNWGSSLTISNSTISGNLASHAGGLLNSSFCHGYNSPVCYSASLTLSNNLIAGNQANTVSAEIQNYDGTASANKFNLFGSTGTAGVEGFTSGVTDIVPLVSLAQIVGPLASNGGPTQTHALIAGSPAINAGDPTGCGGALGALVPVDQRGFSRSATNTICDIGSFEFQAVPPPTPPEPPPPGSKPPPPEPPLSDVLAIGATVVATGEAGASFTGDLKITGGVAPYTVSLASGKLPAGLSLGNDGILSGTLSPTAKSEKITVRVTDSLKESVTQTFTITVIKAVRIVEKAKTGRLGKDYKASFKTKGARGPFSWSITSGALPSGLNFNTTTGAITGIPTQAGEFLLTVQVTDALGGVDVETLALKIK